MSDNASQTREASKAILSIMGHLDIPVTGNFKLEEFENQLVNLAKTTQNAPKLLFTPLDFGEWEKLEDYIQALNTEYAKRVELLKKRLEVTIDSFLWSDRVQKLEPKIREICDRSQFKQAQFQAVEAEELLAADTNLLVVSRTSSEQFRQKTKVEGVSDFKMRADTVPDRGGRTEQITPVQRESFQQQERQRTQQQRGGFRGGGHGGHHGGGGGTGHGQHGGGRGGGGGHWNQRGGGLCGDGSKRGRYY